MAERTDNRQSESGLRFECTCGRTHVLNNVRHYDRFILGCGRRVWALRPLRHGPLEIFPSPDPVPGERFTIN